MIKLLTEDRLHFYQQSDPVAAKALMPFVAYLDSPDITKTYEIVNEGNAPVGVFSSIGKTTYLYLIKPIVLQTFLKEELHVFARDYLLVNEAYILDKENCNVLDREVAMELELSTPKRAESRQVELRRLLEDSFQIMKSYDPNFAFEQYYPNNHHFIRHGYAQVVNLYDDNQGLLATAMVCSAFPDYGALQNVAVIKGQERKRYGTKVIQKLLSQCKYKKVGLLCKVQVEPFYRTLGFASCGNYLFIKV